MNTYQKYIHISRYARYNDSTNRREKWIETVSRFSKFMIKKFPDFKKDIINSSISIINLNLMPSMRLLMTAGESVEKDHVCSYNCAYLEINSIESFSESLYILMCGTGVGFSVEKRCVNSLPDLPKNLKNTKNVHIVQDSKIGWKLALEYLLENLFNGIVPNFDFSRIRKKGERLKTFGGRSSGAEPLRKLFDNITAIFRVRMSKIGSTKLETIDAHDIMCFIAESVVVGGVRRSAMISLSDVNDVQIQNCKSPKNFKNNTHRALSNNSACYDNYPNSEMIVDHFDKLIKSKSGERGIFNRVNTHLSASNNNRDRVKFGTNPCGEIILRPNQFCNLTEVVIKPNDNFHSVLKKIRLATIIGTLQSSLTNFPTLRESWKKNCEEERLLGVSLTGIYDNKLFYTESKKLIKFLKKARNEAKKINEIYAKKLGINSSKAITTIKPSGTVSQLVDSSSGIHPRYSKYYIRRVRNSKLDPLSDFMINSGIPFEEDKFQKDNYVFTFYQKSPKNSKIKCELSALDQFNLWKIYKENWTDHNPSITIYVRKHEWIEIMHAVQKNWDIVGGISFLPSEDDEHLYEQAPYESISEQEYIENFEDLYIDFSIFKEEDDNTKINSEFSCTANKCDL